jgi:hypothetical protein
VITDVEISGVITDVATGGVVSDMVIWPDMVINAVAL